MKNKQKSLRKVILALVPVPGIFSAPREFRLMPQVSSSPPRGAKRGVKLFINSCPGSYSPWEQGHGEGRGRKMRPPQHKIRCRRFWLFMVPPQDTRGLRLLRAPSDEISAPAPVLLDLQVAPRRPAGRARGQGHGASGTDRAQGQSRGTQSRTPRKEEVSLGRGPVRAGVLGRGGRAFKVSLTVHYVKGALSGERQEVTATAIKADEAEWTAESVSR